MISCPSDGWILYMGSTTPQLVPSMFTSLENKIRTVIDWNYLLKIRFNRLQTDSCEDTGLLEGKTSSLSDARKVECLKNDWSSWKVVKPEGSCCVQDDEEYFKITTKRGLLQQPNNQDYTGPASPSHVTMTSHKLTLLLSASLPL